MAGIGPPPTENPRRRNARPASKVLPIDGRDGPAPQWPLKPEIGRQVTLEMDTARVAKLRTEIDAATTARRRTALTKQLDAAEASRRLLELLIERVAVAEAEMWDEIWATPQAVQWEEMSWLREVAQYVRWKVQGENGDLRAATEARQLSDRLGLTPLFMLRLGWSIGAPPKVTGDGEHGDNVVELFG